MDSNPDFSQKRKNLFDCLDKAEKSLVGTTLHQLSPTSERLQEFIGQDRSQNKRHKPEVRAFRQKESIFKRPELPITKCLPARRVPDYQRNPSKWKKYSLEGVDISDNANSSAAFAFLREMDQRKDAEDSDDLRTGGELPTKIEFKRSIKLKQIIEAKEEVDEDDEGTSMRGTKVVMPEYCIGMKSLTKKKERKPPPSTDKDKAKNSALRFQHLMEEEEEDD